MRNNGISITSITALILFVFVSCSSQDEPHFDPLINYLALGDSYTIGQGVQESQRWPNLLSVEIEKNKYEIESTRIIAQTGWTTKDLLNAITDVQSGQYNLVSLLIGVNNQFQGQPFDIFSTEFDSLLNKSIAFAGAKDRVFVLSIPDYGVTPFGSNNAVQIAQEIDIYNNYIKQRCIEQEIIYVDVTGISRQLGSSTGALAEDNLHPSGLQYSKWVEAALPSVLDILDK